MSTAAAEDIKEAVETQETDNDNPYADMSEEDIATARGDVVNEEPTDEGTPPPKSDDETPAQESSAQDKGTEQDSGESDSTGLDEGSSEDAAPEPIRIPKSRFDTVNQRYREEQQKREALEERIAEMEQQASVQNTAPPQTEELAAIDTKIAEALADGDTQQVAHLMSQQREMQAQVFEQRLAAANNNVSAQTMEQMKFDLLLDQLEATRPELKAGDETFDEAKSMETVELVEAFQSKGLSLPDALERALTYIYPEGWQNVQHSTQAESKAPEPQKRETETAKNVAAAKSQPPQMRGGEDSSTAGLRGKVNPMDLSDEEFEKLTEKELAELRGDNF